MRPEDNFMRIESEAGIIATLIHHPEFSFHSENLLPNHFSNMENRYIYQAICELAKKGINSIDPYNIIEVLAASESTRRFADEMDIDMLSSLIDNSDYINRETIEEYKLLVNNVLDASFRRDLYSRLKQCQIVCLDNSEENVREKVANIVDDVMMEYSHSDEIPQFKDVVDEMWQEILTRQDNGSSGIPFKFPLLNEYVTIEPGELIIFGAQQKVGKSIMLLNCAVDLLKRGYSVLYIDSELSSRMFTARLLSHLSGVHYLRLKSGNYDQIEGDRIQDGIEWIKDKPFTHIYMPFFDEHNIYTAIKKVNHVQPLDVVIVDYFKSTGEEGAFETYQALGRCVDLIKNEIAGNMNIAAIGAAQATATNKLADSAKIARNASTIIMLVDKTPEEIDEQGEECGNKKAIVTVNRNGPQHSTNEWIDLQFDGGKISYEQAKKQHVLEEPY